MDAPRYLPAGESAIVVEFGATADPAAQARVLALDAALEADPIDGIRERVPTYRSLMIHFDPRRLGADDLVAALQNVTTSDGTLRTPRHWRIPACYEGEQAEDLEELATLLDRPAQAIADLHAGALYTVVMYGFAPGFVFLSGLPDALAVSRRKRPRPPAPAGALTIANGQALIASFAMPTGWYMLGRTPVRTFDPKRDPAFPIAVGDTLAFNRIDAGRFAALTRDVEGGRDILVAET
jgi:inhibitor of KinA